MTDNHKNINDLIRRAFHGSTFTVVTPGPTVQAAQAPVIPPGNAGEGTEAQRPTENISAKMNRLIRKIAGRQ
jgi:hypothetical protein